MNQSFSNLINLIFQCVQIMSHHMNKVNKVYVLIVNKVY